MHALSRSFLDSPSEKSTVRSNKRNSGNSKQNQARPSLIWLRISLCCRCRSSASSTMANPIQNNEVQVAGDRVTWHQVVQGRTTDTKQSEAL